LDAQAKTGFDLPIPHGYGSPVFDKDIHSMKTNIRLHRMPRNFVLFLAVWALAFNVCPRLMGQVTYSVPPYTILSFAGSGSSGNSDGMGSGARFSGPIGVAADGAGNVYVADTGNNEIRKITSAGVVTTLAGLSGSTGSADGTGSAAQFNHPSTVAVDTTGNVYVADTENHTIRKITPAGVVSTLAGLAGIPGTNDGTGDLARFDYPFGVAVDNAGNVYVGDSGNETIRMITPSGGVSTLAGLAGSSGTNNGTGSAARFDDPAGVAVDSTGNVYVADEYNDTIREIAPGGIVTTLAGYPEGYGTSDGTNSGALFSEPEGVAVDSAGNLFVADTFDDKIRKITPQGTNWVVTTLAGVADETGSANGTGSTAQFDYPSGVAVNSSDIVLVADLDNNEIREVTQAGVVTTLAGMTNSPSSADGTGGAAGFYSPEGLAVDTAGNVYVADEFADTIRKITPAAVVTTFAGVPDASGTNDGTGNAARFDDPSGVALDTAGNIYVADTVNQTIRKITSSAVVSTLAGYGGVSGTNDGTNSAARFNYPSDVEVDTEGNVYVADTGNATIRKVTSAGVVSTLAGLAGTSGTNDGLGSAARFDDPSGVTVDSAGNIYVADSGNETIRMVTSGGQVSTLAGLGGHSGTNDGTGSAARFNYPKGVTLDAAGNLLIADSANATLRKLTPAGVVTTLAGLPQHDGSANGTGSAARFYYPTSLAMDTNGNLYVADQEGPDIRKGLPVNLVPAPILQAPSRSLTPFSFGVSGISGLTLYIESSADLFHWQVVGTYLLNGGTNEFVNPFPSTNYLFYRGQVP
jgi:uncharacterized protein YjiK